MISRGVTFVAKAVLALEVEVWQHLTTAQGQIIVRDVTDEELFLFRCGCGVQQEVGVAKEFRLRYYNGTAGAFTDIFRVLLEEHLSKALGISVAEAHLFVGVFYDKKRQQLPPVFGLSLDK